MVQIPAITVTPLNLIHDPSYVIWDIYSVNCIKLFQLKFNYVSKFKYMIYIFNYFIAYHFLIIVTVI